MADGVNFLPSCPVPIRDHPTVQMAHGGGGRLMHDLIGKMFRAAFTNPLDRGHDGAVLGVGAGRLAFTTDSYVVRPLFFAGGDIGKLAVCGTVNDLAMCGARPAWLSAGFILEEGFPMEDLWRVVRSMASEAEAAGVSVVTGDTKVVDRGHGDGVFINTSGIGVVDAGVVIAPGEVRAGDAVIASGDLGRHGVAILAQREGLEFGCPIESDCASLHGLVEALLRAGVGVHCLRDLTRGGLASALVEIAEASGMGIEIDEAAVPVSEPVRGACELLGMDPLHMANEGRMVAFVGADGAGAALDALRAHPLGAGAVIVGRVTEGPGGRVTMTSQIGARRVIDMLSGEQLPRIC
ncbi:MAG: hydrogenase expression/formation protein HypE [Verrucomicrobiae bacterium]|nr:hydrogenase expression/formation protein HypE [Verrucomicrobiae bacterium]